MAIKEEIVKPLDKNLECVRYEVKSDRIAIWVKSSKKGAVCPYCGTPSTRVHSIYERTIQDLLMLCTKMFCDNENCSKKRFAGTFELVNSRGKMTKRLEEELVKTSMNMSSIQASRLIIENIADIGKSSICNLLKKIVMLFDKKDVRKVCIDDFALKRGQRYGTIMIDLETHIVVDILDSRDCEKVSDWLKGYPNIEIVSRDGSIGYRKAIDEAFGDVIQISDGFRLIKGLSDRCKEYVQKRNAVRRNHSNGLAEGLVNKLKMIKKIMHGRSKFEPLKAKVLLLEGVKYIQLSMERTTFQFAIATGFRRKEKISIDFIFTSFTAESDKVTTSFVNLHRLTADRTPRIGERRELRFVERTKREGIMTRFAKILLRTIVRMSVFAEVRRTRA